MNMPGTPWSASESASVNEFLSSPLGKKWLGVLMSRKPRLDMLSTERAAMTGAYAAGYEQFYNEIVATRVGIEEDMSGAKPIDMTRD